MKRKAVGQASKALATCDAKAAARGATVDLVCVARVGTVFARVWSRAEKRGGCATTGDQTTIKDRTDAHDTDLRTRLVATGPSSKCTALKFRQAGKSARCRLACAAKAAKSGVALTDSGIASCLGACVGALTKGFARAEAKADCRTTGDTATIDSATGAFVACIASLVGPSGSTPCPSVTTTTPGSSTTSTTNGTSTSTTSAPTTTTTGGATTTTPTTSTSSTTAAPAMIRCCVPGSLGGAFVCVVESAADCALASGLDMGAGTCVPDPCPITTTTGGATTTTPTTSTSSTTAAPAMIQCCVPGSLGGAFVCVVESAADCSLASGLDMGAGTCVPDPCPTTTTSTTIVPTTTTSSTVAGSTSTSSSSTTTITLLPCGGLPTPVCLGSCPPGETCTPGQNLLDPCSCVPDSPTTTLATTTSTTLIPCAGLVGPLCSIGACPPGMTCTGAALTACSCQ